VRTPKTRADLAQLAEQLFRKQQVAGSSPAVGSMENPVVATNEGPPAGSPVVPLFGFTPIHTPNRRKLRSFRFAHRVNALSSATEDEQPMIATI